MSTTETTTPRDDALPRTLVGFLERFGDEVACAELLRRWKHPEGFRCPGCGHRESWYLASRALDECRACGRQTSLTAGTVMHGSRKPLTLWFAAMHLFVSSKQGISATELAPQIGVSYPTAWTWLHKLRAAMAGRECAPLGPLVEADETYCGGVATGKHGRGAAKKSVVAAAVELKSPGAGLGRVRMKKLDDASGASIEDFLDQAVRPGALVLTDGYVSYSRRVMRAYDHVPLTVLRSGRQAHELLPGVHRVFGTLDRLLLGTYQGGVSRKHLDAYLAEFEFRFNRRKSASRTLLFQRLLACCVRRAPPAYWQIVGRAAPHIPLPRAA